MEAYIQYFGPLEILLAAVICLVLSLVLSGLFSREFLKTVAPVYVILALAVACLLTGCFASLETVLGWRMGIVILVILLIVTFACWHCRLRLLPDPKILLTVQEKKQRLVFHLRMLAILTELVLLNVGIWLLPSAKAGAAVTLLCVAICMVFLVVARNLAFDAQKQVEALVDQKYQAELLGFMQIIRSQRHDFNFHMQAISGMIENKEYEKCDDYIHTMVHKTTAMNDILPIAHPAISAMLCSFRELAAQKGITLELEITDSLQHIPCTVYEINTVIGNLIQNAIDEVETLSEDKSWIKVLILKRGGIYTVKVTNPCDRDANDFQNCFHPGFSTKRSHEGIGLATVRRIAARYHGSAFLELGDGTVSFLAQFAGHFQ